jgi:hypothetical protein
MVFPTDNKLRISKIFSVHGGVRIKSIGLFSLIGAGAKGSSYQHPRRSGGKKLKAASGEDTTGQSMYAGALCCWNAFMFRITLFL